MAPLRKHFEDHHCETLKTFLRPPRCTYDEYTIWSICLTCILYIGNSFTPYILYIIIINYTFSCSYVIH